jgi:hypothetical protein
MAFLRNEKAATRHVVAGIWLVAAAVNFRLLVAARDKRGRTIKWTDRHDNSHETSTIP